jgi:ABC-type bacteriocin/lantibiotic exporter with double-glycine peptidase domain
MAASKKVFCNSQMQRFALILLFGCTLPGYSAHSQQHPGDLDRYREKVAKFQNMCGVNCLYMLLAFRGQHRDIDDIEKCIRNHQAFPQTITIETLKKSSRDLGIPLTPIEGSQLNCNWTMPVIAHFSGPKGDRRLADGHYIILTEITQQHLTFIDGTSGRLSTNIDHDWFTERASGYYLVASPPEALIPHILPTMVALIAILLSLTIWSFHNKGSDVGRTE